MLMVNYKYNELIQKNLIKVLLVFCLLEFKNLKNNITLELNIIENMKKCEFIF